MVPAQREGITTIWLPMSTSIRDKARRLHKRCLANGTTNVENEKVFWAAMLESTINQFEAQIDPPVIVIPEPQVKIEDGSYKGRRT